MRFASAAFLVLLGFAAGPGGFAQDPNGPQTSEDYFKRALERRQAGDLPGALADYSEAIRLDPKNAFAWNNRGRVKYTQGDLDAAIADYNEAIKLDPRYAVALNNRGIARYDKDDLAGAIADYDQAIRLDPAYVLAWNNRGLARYDKGELDAAIKDFDQAIKLDPKCVLAWANRGRARHDKDDLEGAIADYGEAIALDPEDAMAYHYRGNARSDKGDTDAAITDYDAAIRLDPELSPAWFNRGVAYQFKGDADRAMKNYDEAVRLDPGYVLAWTNRGGLKYDQGLFKPALDDALKGHAASRPGEERDYAAILAMLCRLRLGESDPTTPEIQATFKGRDGKAAGDWPATIAAFLRRQIPEVDFLKAAQSPDKKDGQNRSCEAWFYAGTSRIVAGDPGTAKIYLEKCLGTGLSSFAEYARAKAALARMKEGK